MGLWVFVGNCYLLLDHGVEEIIQVSAQGVIEKAASTWISSGDVLLFGLCLICWIICEVEWSNWVKYIFKKHCFHWTSYGPIDLF